MLDIPTCSKPAFKTAVICLTNKMYAFAPLMPMLEACYILAGNCIYTGTMALVLLHKLDIALSLYSHETTTSIVTLGTNIHYSSIVSYMYKCIYHSNHGNLRHKYTLLQVW